MSTPTGDRLVHYLTDPTMPPPACIQADVILHGEATSTTNIDDVTCAACRNAHPTAHLEKRTIDVTFLTPNPDRLKALGVEVDTKETSIATLPEDTQPAIVSASGWCAPSETIYGIGDAHISRDEALWSGLVEPTPEERQAAADALYEQETQANRDWFATGVLLEHVKRTTFTGLAKDILDLHEMCDGGVCAQCGDEYPVPWPCPTARLVLNEDFDIPDELVYDKPKPVVQDPDNPRWPFPARPLTMAEKFGIPEISVNRGGLRFDTGRQG